MLQYTENDPSQRKLFWGSSSRQEADEEQTHQELVGGEESTSDDISSIHTAEVSEENVLLCGGEKEASESTIGREVFCSKLIQTEITTEETESELADQEKEHSTEHVEKHRPTTSHAAEENHSDLFFQRPAVNE